MSRILQTLISCFRWAAVGVCAMPAGVGLAEEPAAWAVRVRADTQWLTSYRTRQVGTPEHGRLQEDLLARLRTIPQAQVWVHEFPVVVPVYDEAFLEITEGPLSGRHPLFPLWPDGVRLNTTPPEGIPGRLIYVGDAAFDRLPARSLRGQIAVMEMAASRSYRRVFDFGAAAVIFVESEEPGEAGTSSQSLYKPRYYVPASPLADALRSGAISAGTIVCRGSWQTVTARNFYVGVRPAGATGVPPYAVVAPYDSMSVVAGLAPGADAALDCAVALNVLRDEARNPTRPLLFGFLDAYHINQMGIRYMAAMLATTPNCRTRRAYAALEAQDLATYREAAEELARFPTPEAGLAALHDRKACRHLRRLFKDTIGPELLRLVEFQGQLRLASKRRDTENTPAVRAAMLSALRRASAWLLEYHREELRPEAWAELEATQLFAAAHTQSAGGDEERPPATSGSEIRSFCDSSAGGATWAGFAEARQRAERILAIANDPVRVRNRILDAVTSGSLDAAADYLPLARKLWARMADRINGQLVEQERRRAFFEPLDQLRRDLAQGFGLHPVSATEEPVVCPLVVGVDLSDCGVLVGPGTHCCYHRVDVLPREFARALKRAVQQGELWPEGSPERRWVNLDAIRGRMGGGTELLSRALITSATSSFLLPGVTWMTDDALRLRADSPLDREDRLDWSRIEPQLAPTRTFLRWVFTTPETLSKPKEPDGTSAPWRHAMGRIVDVSAGETVPRVPRSGFLVSLAGYATAGDRDGIRRREFGWSGPDGGFRLPVQCGHVNPLHKSFQVMAVRLDASGNIVEALTTVESLVRIQLGTTFHLGFPPGEQLPRAVTFRCIELNGPSFFDARFLEPLTQGVLMDMVRGSSPKRAHFGLDGQGQMWGLVEPDMRWGVILRAGAAGTRMALLNAIANGREQGLSLRETFLRGYAVGERLPSIPAELSARDLAALDDWRLADYRSAGIRSETLETIRATARETLAQAEAAAVRDDGAGLLRSATEAHAQEVRAYQAIREMGQDIARGAIFLMLMLVPFSIVMERLLFASAYIGRQIVGTLTIFLAMTLLLWSFHPAFRISTQPLVIVMAFAILSLSLMVLTLVLRRFKASLREFQSVLVEDSGARMRRGGLVLSAVFLGIANMRKRKVRTLLTGSTVVLVTFALLCFASASSYVDRKDFRIEGGTAEHPSLLVRRPSFGPLSWEAVPSLQNLLGPFQADLGERVWICGGLGETTWRLYVFNPATGAQVPVRAVLGLPSCEDRLTGVDRVLTNWAAFAREGGCYLPMEMAQALGVKGGDTVVFRGNALPVRGVFDPLRLEDEVALLDGQRLLPYDYSRQEQDWLDRSSLGAKAQEMGSSEALQPGANEHERYVPARDVVILPSRSVREMGGTLRSVGMVCASASEVPAVARRLASTIAYPVYYTHPDGSVHVLIVTPLLALPPKNLTIPLAIAALIILTTMLNSVTERKGEIYVYTSLGLAPVHVGALFVAEALTYGLMGAVFGYIAGQGTATALTRLGWMRGVTLNYSGTAVVKTMLLVQGVVGVSAILPAITAGRIAAPSTETDWKVPNPENGLIRDLLPFTVTPQAAPGLVAFLYDYLETHREGVLGRFDVDTIRLILPGTEGAVAGLEARVWLAPFDMGVRQWIRLRVHPPQDDACFMSVEIRHETGSPKVWWRLNRPFLFDLRRQLLGWRKIRLERIMQYIEKGQTTFVTEKRG